MLKDTSQDEFSTNDTKALKGLGIILMLIHHLWAFPERLAGGELKHFLNVDGASLIFHIGKFGQICVPLFFFLGGYGIYKQSEKKDFSILDSIKRLYKSYWKVFFIFIPIGLLFFRNQIAYCADPDVYARFHNVHFIDLFRNFIGESWSLSAEWWFLKYYFISIISFPLVKEIIEKKSLSKNIFYVVIMSILIMCVFPQIGTINQLGPLKNSYLYTTLFLPVSLSIVCFWLGMVYAKEDLIIKTKLKLNLNIISSILILLIIVYARLFAVGNELDILYVPLLVIASIDIIRKIPILNKILIEIGKNSTNMWLIHSFYCYYFYPVVKVVLGLKWAVPCLLVLLILSYISSYIINYFWKFINYIYNKLSEKLSL